MPPGPGAGGLLLAALLTSACGEVVFVDPDAALKAELVFGLNEHLVVEGDPRTYLHVRVRSREAISQLQLSALGAGAAVGLPLEEADRQPCGPKDTCLALSLGPGLPQPIESLRLEVPSIGHAAEGVVVTRHLPAHELFGEALLGNHRVRVAVSDPIRNHYPLAEPVGRDEGETLLFPRRFEAQVSPGPCAATPAPEDAGWQRVTGSPFTTTATFSAGLEPLACVSLRPDRPRSGPAVARATVPARALISDFRHVYTPPVETSPLVFLPIFDLEIPGEARCREAQSLVETAVREAANQIAARGGGLEVLALPPLEVALAGGVPCRQSNLRAFSAAALYDRVERTVTEVYGRSRRVRVVFIYATNLDLDAPAGLVTSFEVLRELFRGSEQLRELVLAVAPDRATRSIYMDRQLPWLATEEPTFRAAIADILSSVWPFRTVLHSAATVVPLLQAEERAAFPAYRVCASTGQVVPLGEPLGLGGALRVGAAGPAYQVSLPAQILEAASSFQLPSVLVEWQGCAGLCDHPTPGGRARVPWLEASDCR